MTQNADFLARLYAKIGPADPVTGCRLWRGAVSREGYGRFSVGTGKGIAAPAHVIVWEVETRTPWPGGLHADHFTCFTRNCVEPSHIRPVVPVDNYRGGGVRRWQRQS